MRVNKTTKAILDSARTVLAYTRRQHSALSARWGSALNLALAALLVGSYAFYSIFLVSAAAPTITISLPTGASTCNTRFSSEDVWPGYFYDQSAPSGSPTLTQRINSLGLDVWRVQAVPGYNDASTSLPSPSAYTTPQNNAIAAWSFKTLDKVLSDGPATAVRLLDLTQPPDPMWTGTNGGQGALVDQTYNALAQYYANVVKYYRTGILQTNSGGSVSYTSTSLTDTTKDFTPYAGGGYAVTATVLDANGFPDWVIGTITGVANAGHTVVVGGWSTSESVGGIPSSTPAAGAAYNLAAGTPPVTSPTAATPWPVPPSVGNVQYFELFNESDLSNSNFPRTSPALLPPTPTLSGVSVAGGTLTAGITYSYRISAVNIGTAESLPGIEASLKLPAGDNAIQVNWSATTNLGLSPFAYRIYGRTSASEQAMVVVGKDALSGLSWIDKGSITPSGALPAADNTSGFQVWRAREYTKMWNAVAPAMKAVDATAQMVGPTISNPQSLAVTSTNTTVVTTGPSDNSWRDSTDYIPYLMSNGLPKPDVVSFHSYGNYVGSASSDASYFNGLSSALSDYKSIDASSVGNTPVWMTETNPEAGFLDNTDYRTLTQLGSAWLADEMIQYCEQAPSVQQLFQFEVANTNTWNLFGQTPPANCYPQPTCLNVRSGEPNLEYWMIHWVSQYFPAGSHIAAVSSVPAGYAAFAAQAPGSTKLSVIVVNTQVGGSPGVGVAQSATIQLSGATSNSTKQVMIDGSTDMTNGPTEVNLGAVSAVNLNLAGYGVALLSFDIGTSSSSNAPTVPANLHTTAVTSNAASFTWSASTEAGGPGVAGYKIYRNGSLVATIVGAANLAYTDSGLSASTSYSYAISAYDSSNVESAQSGIVSVTTSVGAISGDCNADGHVTVVDLSILLSHYGTAYMACDFNGDGTVSIIDLSILLSNYGR